MTPQRPDDHPAGWASRPRSGDGRDGRICPGPARAAAAAVGQPSRRCQRAPSPRRPAPRQEGLLGEYFTGTTFDGTPVLTQVDPKMDFTWTNPAGRPAWHDNYSVRWTGTLTAPTAGSYTFCLTSDDGSRLYAGRQSGDGQLGRPRRASTKTGHHSPHPGAGLQDAGRVLPGRRRREVSPRLASPTGSGRHHAAHRL